MALRDLLRTMALAAGVALGAPVATQACSPAPGYVRPSNFELVQIADAIVVATAIDEAPVPGGERFDRKVRFRISQALKGEALKGEVLKGESGGEIEIPGLVLGRTQPSDPGQIVFSHPEGHMGPCNRTTFSKGASYVLFLKARGAGFVTLAYPFSRVSENYPGEGALWMRAIRTYLRVQAGEAPMAQLTALEAVRDGLLGKAAPTHDETALAADIDQHLGAPSPWKPTAYLLGALDDLKAGRPPRYRPRHPAFDAEQSSAGAYADLILRELGKNGEQPAPPRRDPRQTAILQMLITGDHRDAMPVFDALAAPDAPADDLILAMRFYARNGRYLDAWRLIEERAAPLVATASKDEAWRLLHAIGEVQQDPFYDEGQARWRSDPGSAARWPRLALALSKTAQGRLGDDPGYQDSLKSLLTDYRADPALTEMLSGHFEEIIAWARREATRPDVLASPTDPAADPLVLPLRITLRWMGLGEDTQDMAALTPVLCAGPDRRRLLFTQWGEVGSLHGVDLALRLAASPAVGPTDRPPLAAAVAAWSGRYEAEIGDVDLLEKPALRKLAAGRAITAKDIRPLKPAACR